MEEIRVNKYQTPVTEELLKQYPQEIQDMFMDYITNVPFIRNLISTKRQYAKDRPRDKQGRIIIDLANPHILENMDYFRPSALHFQKYGTYTNLKPNRNPNSPYGRWIREEIKRCWEGYVRPSDGEWVTGYMYFYLNYVPMMVTKVSDDPNKRRASRVEGFPEIWEATYWRFHYIDQARNGGLYNQFQGGNHAVELSRRGTGKSFCLASIMAHNLILGESKEAHKRTTTILTAYLREYLAEKDGTLSKFVPIKSFLAENTQFPRRMITDSPNKMSWKSGYKDRLTGAEMGDLNILLGLSSKDDESKIRGKRGYILFEEFGCHIKGTEVLMYDGSTRKVEDVKLGDYLMGDDGTTREVLHCHSGKDTLYKITLSNGDSQIVNSRHLVYFKHYDWYKKEYKEELLTPKEVLKYKNLNKGNYIIKADNIRFAHKEVPIDPYWFGLWLGDGDKYGARISSEDEEVISWVENYAALTGLAVNKRFLPQSKKCYCLDLSGKLPSGKTFRSTMNSFNLLGNKHIPDIYKVNDAETLLNVIAGLIDTDGTYCRKKRFFEITQSVDRKYILDDIKFMCDSLGLRTSMSTRIQNKKAKGAGKLHYRLRISGHVEIIPTKITRKKADIPNGNRIRRNWNEYTFKIEEYGEGEYYGFTVDKNHLFLLKDFSIVHNSFPNLLDVYNNVKDGMKEGKYTYGISYLVGTSGDEASDFHGAQELVYNPQGYEVYAIPNKWDRPNQGRPWFAFFTPAYVNLKGYYNNDGVSDVVGGLLLMLQRRYNAKYKTSDPKTIIQEVTNMPITPAEAMLQGNVSQFPVTDIEARLQEINANPNFYDNVAVGQFIITNDTVEFTPTADTPIRYYQQKDNKNMPGAVEIFEMPQKDAKGNVYEGRYIAGADPYDNDESTTTSLGSILVLDLMTDRIVAEYTGRPQFADDYFEICRRMCIFYNARLNYENNKKGLYSHFLRMNSTYLLTDVLEILKDKQMVKFVGVGNTMKGTTANQPVNGWARQLIAKWLLTPQVTIIKEGEEEKEITLHNLNFIKNKALLIELSQWNPVGNFDRVSALGMLMLLREDKLRLMQGRYSIGEQDAYDPNDIANDPYFKDNYEVPEEELLLQED